MLDDVQTLYRKNLPNNDEFVSVANCCGGFTCE